MANSILKYNTVANVRFPPIFPRENIEFALNYKPLNTDKFLITYPKCGTTWTHQIILLILNNGIPKSDDKDFLLNSFIEMSGNLSLNTSLNPRVIKTHLQFDLLPYNKSAKYLCVLRNPKDTCVSYYHFAKKVSAFEFNGDFHDFFKYWINGEYHYGDYFQYILSYWSHRFDDNFSFLVYEHMKYNTRDAFLKIAQFLGDQFVIKLKENDEMILNKVIENSTIDSMKSSLKALDSYALMRKGIVGDWRNHFTKSESDLVDEKVKQYFTGTGLDELWIEEMKW